MKTQILKKLLVLLMAILIFYLIPSQVASAASGSKSIYCGEVVNAWSPDWRYTFPVVKYQTYTVYFYPERIGNHKIKVYGNPISSKDSQLYITSSWSNGGSWNYWPEGSKKLADGTTQTINLWAGQKNIKFRFDFTNAASIGFQGVYKFFCYGKPN